jgi:signal transduction histidine kinase
MTELEKISILLVDDQLSKLLTYGAILGELGENLIKATSGRAALDQLLKHDVAVVLLDVSMPEMDGFEVAEMIRQHPRFHKTAIIFVSGIHLTDLDRVKGYARGAVDYVPVPVNPELLRAKVHIFADLYRKTRQLETLNSELRSLSSMLIAAQDKERHRIARELHDGLGQELTAAKITLEAALRQENLSQCKKQAETVSTMIEGSIQQVRNISYLLHPPLLDEMGLRSALHVFIDGLAKRGNIEVAVDFQPADFSRFKPELEAATFRIIQEALTNVFRHSGANKARITVQIADDQLIVTVRDNGKGVAEAVAKFRPNSIGIGVSSMMQRVKEFGGEFRVRNANPGTIVEAILPINRTTSGDSHDNLPA